MKVLIAEDDPNTRAGLEEIISSEGYETHAASNGSQALALFKEHNPDVVCLDIMMPELSGYDVCKEIRKTHPLTGILFISAKSEEIDTVLGLELGADDYIVKPFGVKSVIARIRAVTRRVIASRNTHLKQARTVDFFMTDLRIAPEELRAYRDEIVVELSLRDLQILTLLHRERGKAVDRDTLFEKCWDYNFIPNSRCLDQHISQLRKRIELDHRSPQIIKTVHGVGYRYE
ncbi:MAG: DNA-binding response OmpR family regulator [Verrucomicrobiales bacterium]|jgi:DNA-binding response OmpR family regulator